MQNFIFTISLPQTNASYIFSLYLHLEFMHISESDFFDKGVHKLGTGIFNTSSFSLFETSGSNLPLASCTHQESAPGQNPYRVARFSSDHRD